MRKTKRRKWSNIV